MDWSDERYVRLYTRETRDIVTVGWQGRCLFPWLMCKVDRAGILDYGSDSFYVSEITKLPLEIVEVGMERLAALGMIELMDGNLVIPNFIEAQEATSSDRQRQAESRARRRDKARAGVTQRDEPVTKRDIESPDVTSGHASSHGVTAGHTVSQPVTPYCAVPDRTVPSHTDLSCAPEAHDSQPSKPKTKRQPKWDWLAVYSPYPRKVGKAAGLRKLGQLKADMETYQRILAASIEMGQLWVGSDTTYCPQFSTWVNQRRWEDESQQGPSADSSGSKPLRNDMAELQAEIEREERRVHQEWLAAQEASA